MDEDEDEDAPPDQRESWFAGGERSGISVQNPDAPSRRGGRAVPGGGMVRDLLRRAAQAGTVPIVPAVASPEFSIFSGGGHTLGSDDIASTFVPDPNAPNPAAPAQVQRRLIFYRNGFVLHESPFMAYDDPQSREVLQAIHAGRVPQALLALPPLPDSSADDNASTPPPPSVQILVEQRTHEEYVPPVTTWDPRGGVRLGAAVPGDASASTSTQVMPGAFDGGSTGRGRGEGEGIAAGIPVDVDETQPIAQIQVRLANGGRFLARLNHAHTVADLRRLIDARNGPSNYTLHTTFPTRELDDGMVVGPGEGDGKDKGLAGCVVVQRVVG
ncbi:SEP-domain-containing protein [Favolaschia claudopus]|uniref:SEP-domain-containing protein n=1 Tax=Favolaschia claudopus TaxID=2862362 RepID=A0AAW0AWK3_9AGAR